MRIGVGERISTGVGGRCQSIYVHGFVCIETAKELLNELGSSAVIYR